MSRKWTIHDVERVRDAGLGVNIGTEASHPSVRFVIGVDPGKHTGVAIWDRQEKVFTQVSCMLIHQAFELVKKMAGGMNVLVRVEDARQRTWFGNTGREKLQGAGAAKRDAAIWEDFLRDRSIPFELVAPKNNKTKVTAAYFRSITGWAERTNGHARDAGMLCWKC